jgi:cytochrome b6-f complex iron-sulfur subunit
MNKNQAGKDSADKNRTRKNLEPAVPPRRRNFLKVIWVSLGLVALGEFFLVILSFFRPAPKKETSGTLERIIDAGSTDAYTPGTVAAFITGQFYLVCLEDGGFMALSSKCTHLGCAVPWNKVQQKFICPCHASQFDIQGNVLSSPAPRALDLFKLHIVNKKIQVDINNRIKRNRFSKEQVVYPETVTLLEKAGKP